MPTHWLLCGLILSLHVPSQDTPRVLKPPPHKAPQHSASEILWFHSCSPFLAASCRPWLRQCTMHAPSILLQPSARWLQFVLEIAATYVPVMQLWYTWASTNLALPAAACVYEPIPLLHGCLRPPQASTGHPLHVRICSRDQLCVPACKPSLQHTSQTRHGMFYNKPETSRPRHPTPTMQEWGRHGATGFTAVHRAAAMAAV